ncbi:hypothetical protein I3843_04G074800 [Carya illinoinensis]|nr:hypothetical protein I3843_04G074800 [Carya illinoinensis]
MEDDDESHGNGPNSGNPESSCLKSSTIIMIPVNVKISKDAKEAVQECVSEFISFVTDAASVKCQREKRKTHPPSSAKEKRGRPSMGMISYIWAITTLGLEDYVSPLKTYLQKFREIEGEKLNIPKQQRSSEQRQNQQYYQQEQNYIQYDNCVSSSTTCLMSQSISFMASDQPAFDLHNCRSPQIQFKHNYSHKTTRLIHW